MFIQQSLQNVQLCYCRPHKLVFVHTYIRLGVLLTLSI